MDQGKGLASLADPSGLPDGGILLRDLRIPTWHVQGEVIAEHTDAAGNRVIDDFRITSMSASPPDVLCTGESVAEYKANMAAANMCAEWVPSQDAAARARGVRIPCGCELPCAVHS